MTIGNITSMHERWAAFASSPGGRRAVRVLRVTFAAAIVGLLVFQLSAIGWGEIMQSLPTTPWFYAILLAMYSLLPVSEAFIYGRLWGLRARDCLGVMLRKRVLNVDVVGYSGEVYLFLWARRRVRHPARRILSTIKDNLIVSSAASLAAAVLLLAGLLLTGQIALEQLVPDPNPLYAGLAVVAAVLAAALLVRFRRLLIALSRRATLLLGAVHLHRFLIGYVLQILQWWVVLPSVPFQTWALLLVVFVLINRIPLLPSSDLVFVSAGAGLIPLLDAPVAPVVAMLLIRSATDRLLNLVLFSATVWRERHRVYIRGDLADLDHADAGQESPPQGQERSMPVKT